LSVDVTWSTSHRVSQLLLVVTRCFAKDVHRHRLPVVTSGTSPVQSRTAVNDPSELVSVGVGDSGRVGDDGWGRVVLEYGREVK
jgi:hypothetical protein